MPGAREHPEDRRPDRGEPGVATAPERRVRRYGEQQRERAAQTVEGAHRARLVAHPHVDVLGERRLAMRQHPHRGLDLAVARRRSRYRRRPPSPADACPRPLRAARARRAASGPAHGAAARARGRRRPPWDGERSATRHARVRLGGGLRPDAASTSSIRLATDQSLGSSSSTSSSMPTLHGRSAPIQRVITHRRTPAAAGTRGRNVVVLEHAAALHEHGARFRDLVPHAGQL